MRDDYALHICRVMTIVSIASAISFDNNAYLIYAILFALFAAFIEIGSR